MPTLSTVEPGMPDWCIPDFSAVKVTEIIVISLSVAVVIMAETLLAENNFAQKNGYRIDDNQEILAFAIGNMAAAFTGCCPINGSVSRTAMSEQYDGKTQLTGIVAGLSMIVVLLFCTGFIGYLPIPVLTAIVISALMGATEFHLAKRLWKVSRTEFFIFAGAFWELLILGTINGCPHRNYPLVRRNDNKNLKTGQMFSGSRDQDTAISGIWQRAQIYMRLMA